MDLKQIFNLLRFIIVMIAIVAIGVAYITCSQLKANLIGFHEPFDIHDSFHHYQHEQEIKEDLARESIMRAIDASEEEKRIQNIKDSDTKPTLKDLVQQYCDSEKEKKARRKIDMQLKETDYHDRNNGTFQRANEKEHNVRDNNNQRERDRNPLGKD